MTSTNDQVHTFHKIDSVLLCHDMNLDMNRTAIAYAKLYAVVIEGATQMLVLSQMNATYTEVRAVERRVVRALRRIKAVWGESSAKYQKAKGEMLDITFRIE